MFQIEITEDTLQEVRRYLYDQENGLVETMNIKGLSFPAMAFILQSLMDATNNAIATLEEGDSSDNK